MREVDRLYREIEGAEVDGYFVDLAISSTWRVDGGDWDREPSSELLEWHYTLMAVYDSDGSELTNAEIKKIGIKGKVKELAKMEFEKNAGDPV